MGKGHGKIVVVIVSEIKAFMNTDTVKTHNEMLRRAAASVGFVKMIKSKSTRNI